MMFRPIGGERTINMYGFAKPVKTCACGSGKSRYELRDAANIFCAFVCEDCEKKRKEEFNPRIFQEYYDPDKTDVGFSRDT
jgi:hypothetical protein